MTQKILVGALLAGLVVFVWEFFFHVLSPLGTVGVSGLPAEEAVLESLRSNLPEAGLYIFPGQLDDDMDTVVEKYQRGPVGLLVYKPGGGSAMDPVQLGRQLVLDVLAGALLAWLLVSVGAKLRASIAYGAGVGVFAVLVYGVPQWNWYNFPMTYTLASGADIIIGWTLGGAVLGWWLNRRAGAAAAA